MKIRTHSFQVKDDYGVIMEVCLLDEDTELAQAESEIQGFFSHYRIKSAMKAPIIPEKAHEQINKHQNLPEESPLLAAHLSFKERTYIIRKYLPDAFGHNDFIRYIMSNTFNGGKYSEFDARQMWKSIIASLMKHGKVEVVNKGTQTKQYKYRYIGTDTLDEVDDLAFKKLRNGEKIEV